jgi:hypothetical protein
MKRLSSKLTITLCAVAALAAGRALASDVDYDANPITDWSSENRMLDQCTALGKLGTPTCKYDQASFDKHYKQHKQNKPGDRDRASPHDYCQGAVSMLNGNQASSAFAQVLASDKPAKAFSSKVHAITCAYDDNPKSSPSLKLVNGTLVITLRWGDFQDPTSFVRSNDWYLRDLAALFPEFKVAWNAKHPHEPL